MGTVMTVLGPIASDALGQTLSHEHIFCDFTTFLRAPKTPEEAAFLEQPVSLDNLWRMRVDPYSNRDECRLDSMDTAIRELTWFREAGGSTITELSLEGSGRDVVRLAEVSRKTGVQIICGCGHYIDATLPAYVRQSSVDALTEQYIREIRCGVGDTGIRPGIIGEIGTSYHITPDERKVLRAAAQAQRKTNLALTIHLDPGARRGHDVLDLLIREEGVRPEKIILGHPEFALAHPDIDFYEGVDYLISLAARGCFVEFELCGNTTVYKKDPPLRSWVLPTDLQRTIAIRMLCNRGFSNQIVLSHDQGLKHFLRSYGGWGYTHVLTDFRDYLCEAGLDEETIRKFNTANPARYLPFD